MARGFSTGTPFFIPLDSKTNKKPKFVKERLIVYAVTEVLHEFIENKYVLNTKKVI